MPSQIPLPLGPVLQAQWARATQKHGIIGEAHLFLELLDDESDETVSALLALSGVSRDEARLYAESWLENAPDADKKVALSRSASQVVRIASLQAQFDFDPTIETHHLFLACVSHRKGAHLGEVLRPLGFDLAQLRAHLRGLQAQKGDFTPRAERALEAAQAEMRASYCGRISTAHLLLGLLSDEAEEKAEYLGKAGVDFEKLRQAARDSIKSDGEIAIPQKRFSPGAKRALERAAREAKQLNHGAIDCGHLLLALLPRKESLGEKWRARGRKLDCVEGLWTAEEALALRGALENAPIGRSEKIATAKKQASALEFGVCSFIMATCWAILLPIFTPSRRNGFSVNFVVFGVAVLIISGIGACLLMLFGKSQRAKDIWLRVFEGWLLGLMIGMYLFNR